ncbi:DNA methyltransferase [Helicobacter cinaedi]|uniref:DNA methyltransferase n=1 Tax=Helicobacter cinaedi TaxID=213 RepID=UPI000DA22195|nr:site-specific DNA-methyltransferase [Helicobacter cinaedi]
MQKATHKEHNLLQTLQEKFQSIENLRTLAIDSNRELLSFLLENAEFRERFFTRVDSVAVFEKDKFLDFLKLRMLNKSYTAFSNKIGLQLESSFENTSKVVLNFPFKDCVLKGAQSKDEQKSKEIFFNEVLARSEIDILFSPKALQNFELIGQGDLKENLNNANLLIKGNNLLALHSLKKKFAKKKFANQVKLIYIDPPYNTGNDSFNYNDNFNHSTWLTFMKNRLEIAKEFLRDDGVIFIQCDDNEQAYLKVLMDEIFGRENFVNTICWEKKYSPANDAKWLSDNHDFILIYAKRKETWKPNLLPRTEEMNARYTNPDNDPRGRWKTGGFSVKTYTANYDYPITTPSGKIVYPPSGSCWQTSKENYEKMLQDNRIYFGKNGDSKPQIKQFLSEVQQGVVTKTFWKYDECGHNQIGKQEIKALFANSNTDLFSTPKPEALLKRIIEISTQENDLVMDFFAGSGTTLAVAHKMKRRWIGIEQMDYIESITKERLKKVVAGEQGGISKAANWQGGGSFIYAELMPLNVMYKEKIQNLACHTAPCHTKPCEVSKNVESTKDLHKDISLSLNMTSIEKELEKIYNDLESKAFVDYRVDIQAMLKDKEFYALSLDEKRKVLYAILDSNMDYVLYDDIDDSEYGVSDELRELNKIFYGENDE